MSKLNFLCVLIVAALFCAAVVEGAWTTRQLSPSEVLADQADMAVFVNNVYTVWREDTPGNWEIYFRKSIDGGSTWQTRQRITRTAGESRRPAIALDRGTIYVVWQDDTPGNYEIYFRKSTDGGSTWQTMQRLTTNAGNSELPSIAVFGSDIYVTWDDNTPGNYDIYFLKSTDGGATWQTAKRITTNADDSGSSAIVVDGSYVFMAWASKISDTNCEIYFKKSIDGGATWQATQRLTNNAGVSMDPAVAERGDNVYVAWQDTTPGNYDIYFRKSTDGGATWNASKKLTANAGNSRNLDMAVYDANICVAWDDSTPGNEEIYLKKSTDNGATWQTAQRLTYNSGDSWRPAVAVSSAKVYVAWDEDVGEWELVFLKYSPL